MTMSRFGITTVSSVGSYGLMENMELRPGGPATLHVAGNSFDLVVKATNIFDNRTNVGSHWTDISSPITTPGIYHLPNYSYGAVLFQVNSVTDPIILAVG
jgi:hypothetical protein